jgi:hypothetical protein
MIDGVTAMSTLLQHLTAAQFAMIADQAACAEADRQRDAKPPQRPLTAAEWVKRAIPVLPSERVLSDMLYAMSLDALLELEVIMCIGCEAEEPQHYRKAVASLRRRFHDHDATVAYLVGKAPLHEYLRRGWERLREEPRPWPPTEA